mgnify:FL=1
MFKKTEGYVQSGNPFPVTSCGRRRNNGSPLMCWREYEQEGYKKKGNRTVPNCVPK